MQNLATITVEQYDESMREAEQRGYEHGQAEGQAEVARLAQERDDRASDITPEQAHALQDILRTLTHSGTALTTSARELVMRMERAEVALAAMALHAPGGEQALGHYHRCPECKQLSFRSGPVPPEQETP